MVGGHLAKLAKVKLIRNRTRNIRQSRCGVPIKVLRRKGGAQTRSRVCLRSNAGQRHRVRVRRKPEKKGGHYPGKIMKSKIQRKKTNRKEGKDGEWEVVVMFILWKISGRRKCQTEKGGEKEKAYPKKCR